MWCYLISLQSYVNINKLTKISTDKLLFYTYKVIIEKYVLQKVYKDTFYCYFFLLFLCKVTIKPYLCSVF